MSVISKILAPRVDVNNESVSIFSMAKRNGDQVHAGEVIACAETSKGTEECLSEAEGFIYYMVEEGAEVKIGACIACVTDIQEAPQMGAGSDGKFEKYQITKKARALVEKHKLDLSGFDENQIIKEKDILDLLRPAASIAPTLQNKLIIMAAGGHAKMCIEIIRQTRTFEIYGITDPTYPCCSAPLGVPVIGRDDDLPELYAKGYRKLVNGLGAAANHPARKALYEKYKNYGFEFPNLIHPRAIVEPSVKMGEGNQIMAGAILGPDVVVGSNCIINSGAVVSHDSVIADHVHVAPGAIVAGSVTVGENSLIGMGVTVYFGVKIGENVVIRNGCNVFSDVPDGTVVK